MNEDRNEGVQVTVVQLEEYGPWTVSLEPRRREARRRDHRVVPAEPEKVGS